MTPQKYLGSCDCEAVKFEAILELDKGTGRCNCTTCMKKRWWGMHAMPKDIKMLTPEKNVSRYRVKINETDYVEHVFCKHCGVHPFGLGHIQQIGGDYASVNVAALDGITPEEFGSLKIKFMDGLNNNWWNEPKVTKYL